MRKKIKLVLFLAVLIFPMTEHQGQVRTKDESQVEGEIMKLPKPRFSSSMSVEETLAQRRSVRDYSEDSLSLEEVSQLLWAAQGVTSEWGGRTAPSAGALYPLEIYLLAGEVRELDTGLYHYNPAQHALTMKKKGDLRQKMTEASLDQDEISRAPVTIIISAAYERTTGKYGDRTLRYVHMEVGSAAENIYLQAESLELGTVFIGAFDDEEVKAVLGIEEEPLGIMPVGKK